MVGPEHVMGLAVGNELELLYTHAPWRAFKPSHRVRWTYPAHGPDMGNSRVNFPEKNSLQMCLVTGGQRLHLGDVDWRKAMVCLPAAGSGVRHLTSARAGLRFRTVIVGGEDFELLLSS